MIQKIKVKKVYILLFILYVHSLHIFANQAGDLDITFGTNGVVKSGINSSMVAHNGFSVTGLALRKLPYNDIVVSSVQMFENKPVSGQSLVASYRKKDGSLNTDGFGTLSQPGFSVTTGGQFNAVSSFLRDGQHGLILAGLQAQHQAQQGDVPLLKKVSHTGVNMDAKMSDMAHGDLAGAFNAVIQHDQYVYAAGYDSNPQKSLKFTRYNLSNFGNVKNYGNVYGDGPSELNGIAMQSDGRVVAAGQATINSYSQFLLMRYLPNATLDSSLPELFPFPDQEGSANAIAMVKGRRDREKIVAAGWVKEGSKQLLALVRYHLDGTPDSLFGSQGKVIEDFGGVSVIPHAIAIDKYRRIVVAGEFIETETSNSVFIVARYLNDGTLDKSFGQNTGWVTTNISPNGASINAIGIDDDNSIICGGYSINSDGLYEITLARYVGYTTTGTTGGITGATMGQESGHSLQPFNKYHGADSKSRASLLMIGERSDQPNKTKFNVVFRKGNSRVTNANLKGGGNMVFITSGPGAYHPVVADKDNYVDISSAGNDNGNYRDKNSGVNRGKRSINVSTMNTAALNSGANFQAVNSPLIHPNMRVGLLASRPLLHSTTMTNNSAKALFEALKTHSATVHATRESVNLANASINLANDSMQQDRCLDLYRGGCVNGEYIVRDSISNFVGSVKREKAHHVRKASEYGVVSVGLSMANVPGARIVTATVI